MGGRAGLVLCPEAKIYDHGPEHPLRPQRVQYTWDLISACGLLDRPGVSTLHCRSADDEELGLVHSDAYIDATRRAGHGEDGDWSRFGYGPGDNPIFRQMHEAGALVAGASIVAAESVHTGAVDHAFNAAGGLHHAMPSRASGFCVYDDPAIAIAWLLREGVHPIAYVDVDVHHGDGPQAIFYEDPRVLTISLHESGEYLFPGTGFVTERGAAAAEGTKVNVPLAPGTGDEAWLAAFRRDRPAPPFGRSDPTVLVTQLGCDTHATDPLAHLRLTTARIPGGRAPSCTRSPTRRRAAAGSRPAEAGIVGPTWCLERGPSTSPRCAAPSSPTRSRSRGSRRSSSRSAARCPRPSPSRPSTGTAWTPRPIGDRARSAGRASRTSGSRIRGTPTAAAPSSSARSGRPRRRPNASAPSPPPATDVFRVNLSHGDAGARASLVELVRAISKERDEDLAVMMDLPGPKIRLGELAAARPGSRSEPASSFAPTAPRATRPARATTYPGLAPTSGPATASCSPTARSS